MLLVSEESIKEGMRLLFDHAGLVVEPAAALGVAAILENQDRFATKSVATVLCGSNVSPEDFQAWVMELGSNPLQAFARCLLPHRHPRNQHASNAR